MENISFDPTNSENRIINESNIIKKDVSEIEMKLENLRHEHKAKLEDIEKFNTAKDLFIDEEGNMRDRPDGTKMERLEAVEDIFKEDEKFLLDALEYQKEQRVDFEASQN